MKKLIIAVLAVAALAVLNLTYQDSIKPDAVFQMANQHITWHYAGK